MEWHHFEYFKQLAQTENMSECAKMLNVSQSTLSRAIISSMKWISIKVMCLMLLMYIMGN